MTFIQSLYNGYILGDLCLQLDFSLNQLAMKIFFNSYSSHNIHVTGFMKTVQNRTLEVTRYSILKFLRHYNQPRIVNTWMKHTQNVDHFTMFESFPSTSFCSQRFPPNKIEKFGCEVVSGMFTLRGMDWREKVIVQIVVGHQWSPKTSLEGLCQFFNNGWNEAKSTRWTFGLLKQAATLDMASPDTCQCLKPPCKPFKSPWIHPFYNQPRVGRLKFRLETNNTVVWLYAGGVSLILPDV